MEVIKYISEMRPLSRKLKAEGKSIGLIPTMGALHKGHLSLVETSIRESDITIATLFVNPTQFNNHEDFENYPVSTDEDLEMFRSAGVDIVFAPSKDEMYPAEPTIKIHYGPLQEVLEGKYRPGHFNGVGLVVSKLFNICEPDRAYFGQKDLQQFMIIKQLAEELKFGITLRLMPIIREENGLAMSSRNRRLSPSGYSQAALIYQSLVKAEHALKSGMILEETVAMVEDLFHNQEDIELEYFEIVDMQSLRPITHSDNSNELALCIACYVEGIRLIDNTLLNLR